MVLQNYFRPWKRGTPFQIKFGAENFDSRNRRFRFYYCSLWKVDRPLADFCDTIDPGRTCRNYRTNVGVRKCAFNRSVQHRLQSIGWRLEAQGLSRTLIEPQSNRVKITLRDAREIGSSREVLPQQAVGVLV